MVWGGVSMHSKTPLVVVRENLNANRFQQNIVRPVILPHIATHRGMMLAQDNAPCYAARATRNILLENNVRLLDWPACSPDLNPIEHIWDLLKRKVRSLPQPENLLNLENVLLNQWQNIAQNTIQTYIGSMRRRCQAVIQANGGHTRY